MLGLTKDWLKDRAITETTVDIGGGRGFRVDRILELINRNSPFTKALVEVLSYNFTQELDRKFIFRTAKSSLPDDRRIMLFTSSISGMENTLPIEVVGFCAFRQFKSNGETTNILEMTHIWLNPYWRRCGRLTQMWPVICEKFGPFFVRHDSVNMAMGYFLMKQKFQKCYLSQELGTVKLYVK